MHTEEVFKIKGFIYRPANKEKRKGKKLFKFVRIPGILFFSVVIRYPVSIRIQKSDHRQIIEVKKQTKIGNKFCS